MVGSLGPLGGGGGGGEGRLGGGGGGGGGRGGGGHGGGGCWDGALVGYPHRYWGRREPFYGPWPY